MARKHLALLLLFAFAFRCDAAEEWWSLQPLIETRIPPAAEREAQNPIDHFILSALKEKGLSPSPSADRHTLIRRLYFDLIGLPPAPEEVRRFVADESPRSYEHLVDRLLASPQYGERWARHWLDVVHYGDTHGYDKDQPRPNAWKYRDYVIRAFNEDKSYARFVKEQLAGDVFWPGEPDAIEALGFISAGPWDLIGHAELPETKIDGKIARHLDRDDMVANTMSTFTSMTVHCAQCHDHKFDRISSEEYYSLQSVFAAVDRTNVEYYQDAELNLTRAALKSRERTLARAKVELEDWIEKHGGSELAEAKKELADARKRKTGERPAEYGYHSQIEANADKAKWVQVDLGERRSIRKVAISPCWDDFGGIGAGFGFPVRFKVEVSEDAEFESGELVHDQTTADFSNPELKVQEFFADVRARFVRVTATKLAPRQNDYIFALAELEVFDERGTNVARGVAVSAMDSIEAPVRWAKANLVDGRRPASGGGTDTAKLEEKLAQVFERAVDKETKDRWRETTNSLNAVRTELDALPKPELAFVGAVHHGSGSFRGTGPGGGKPRPIHLLNRGDVRKPGKLVEPGALSAVKQLSARFNLEANAMEGERRRALAEWITDPQNPLTWRSIVNRIWQYHFGSGLVETPNDFGRMGARPTHPELLDWLAREFRDNGQSFKKLQKLIVTSATYQQVSTTEPSNPAEKIDGENRLLWRMNRRKLEAEAVRDSILQVSGKLSTAMFGPGFQDFVIEKPEHSPHYQYHLYDPDDPKSHRRSIYRFIVRSQQQPFMTTLDCADPSMQVEKRNESVSALQALALLNNGFVVAMSKHFANRLAHEASSEMERVDRAFWLTLGRAPSDVERRELAGFAEQHGWTNACRLLFNLNEFAFAD